jgi:hypothetical protein
MKGLGLWTRTLDRVRRARPKAQRKISKRSSRGKSSLSEEEHTSGSRESAAVHFVQSDLASFGDETGMSDDDPAVARTVETLAVVRSDGPTSTQEKEAESSGRIPSR